MTHLRLAAPLAALLLLPAITTAQPSAFLTAHCVKCHGADKQLGGVTLHDLPADPAKDVERWAAVRDQIRDGLMPPAKEPRPKETDARAVVAWITEKTGVAAGRLPNHGHLIPHDLLFGRPPGPAVPPPPRVWRLSPDAYLGFARDVSRGRVTLVQPFTLIPERGIRDYAGLYSIDEPSTEILLRNAEAIVAVQTAYVVKDGKLNGGNGSVREFVQLMHRDHPPTKAQLEAAVRLQYKLAITREPSADELARFLALYDKCAAPGDRPGAVRTMLQAVLLKTDAMFRSEVGGAGSGGRRMLVPHELARAVSLALGDQLDRELAIAAEKGEVTTPVQVAAHVRRLMTDPKANRPRVLRFFREYFEYAKAPEVFKPRPTGFMHEPRQLVADTDRLVLWVLAQDRDVFRALLTTPAAFVNTTTKTNKQTRMEELVRAVVPNPNNNKGQKGVESVYGVQGWRPDQPMTLPENTRLGVLMQPSWLTAFSTNFENDPVRRGRWVRERLLGGTVPDLPIGVAAQVPDEPHRTFRDRLTVTRAAACWKCHRRMDDLGLPFEQFDHYGRFRVKEEVLDREATERNVDKKGKSLGPVQTEVELKTAGLVAESGDPALDGPVADPRELVRRVAGSDRARQVFVRHAFRFFLGRNETLSDSKALQDADRAYVESGGSFRALVVSLLTSDAFLYRSGN